MQGRWTLDALKLDPDEKDLTKMIQNGEETELTIVKETALTSISLEIDGRKYSVDYDELVETLLRLQPNIDINKLISPYL